MESQTTSIPLPPFFIGKDLTAERINNYVSQKHNLLSTSLGKPDTRSVWYSKEHLIKLLEEVDHANGNGLRIYFGAYENSHPEFAGQTCLLMVVTREAQEAAGTVNQNVLLENEPGFNDRSSVSRSMSTWNSTDDLLTRKKDFNHGSPCPPLCDSKGGGLNFP